MCAPSSGPRDVTVVVDASGMVTMEWQAPAALGQTVEHSSLLRPESWIESPTAPENVGGEAWRWQEPFAGESSRHFRIRW